MQQVHEYKDLLGELKVTYTRTEKPTAEITSSASCYKFVKPYFDESLDTHEEFKIIYLNNAGYVVNVDSHSSGGMTSVIVDVRLVIRKALQMGNLVSVILAHNHPSGTLKPSSADIAITKKLKEAFKFFDIDVLDHLILTRETYFSFADEILM